MAARCFVAASKKRRRARMPPAGAPLACYSLAREDWRARAAASALSHTPLPCTRFTNLTFTRRLVGSSHVTLAAPSERAANVVQRRDGFYFRIVVVSLFCLPLVSPARVARARKFVSRVRLRRYCRMFRQFPMIILRVALPDRERRTAPLLIL